MPLSGEGSSRQGGFHAHHEDEHGQGGPASLPAPDLRIAQWYVEVVFQGCYNSPNLSRLQRKRK